MLIYDGLLSLYYQETEAPTRLLGMLRRRVSLLNGLFLGSRSSHNVEKKLISTMGCSLVYQLAPKPFAAFDAFGCFQCVKTRREIWEILSCVSVSCAVMSCDYR